MFDHLHAATTSATRPPPAPAAIQVDDMELSFNGEIVVPDGVRPDVPCELVGHVTLERARSAADIQHSPSAATPLSAMATAR